MSTASLGVIVARFQVPKLHEGHRNLIMSVAAQHSTVLIVLGTSEVMSERNPLSYEQRRQIVLWATSGMGLRDNRFIFRQLPDHPSDEQWSADLDNIISSVLLDDQALGDIQLYGSRDSFFSHYSGAWSSNTVEFPPHADSMSGDEIRKQIRAEDWMPHFCINQDQGHAFVSGIVWATGKPYPTVYTTVDGVLVNHDGRLVLLGRKAGMKKFCLIGGFADPKSRSDEEDLRREVKEETGIGRLVDVQYIGDFHIEDWRYQGGPHSIRTRAFVASIDPREVVVAGDDIEEVSWFNVADVSMNLQKSHQGIWEVARKFVLGRRKICL